MQFRAFSFSPYRLHRKFAREILVFLWLQNFHLAGPPFPVFSPVPVPCQGRRRVVPQALLRGLGWNVALASEEYDHWLGVIEVSGTLRARTRPEIASFPLARFGQLSSACSVSRRENRRAVAKSQAR